MKSKLAALTLLTFAFSCKIPKNKTYTIIKPGSTRLENGVVDTTALNALSEPMKAVAYLYFSSTNHVRLITDPESAKQESALHLSLFKKYFPNERSLGITNGQRQLRAALAATKHNYFTTLTLFENKDTITASYTYDTISQGEILSHNSEDLFIVDGKGLKRVQ